MILTHHSTFLLSALFFPLTFDCNNIFGCGFQIVLHHHLKNFILISHIISNKRPKHISVFVLQKRMKMDMMGLFIEKTFMLSDLCSTLYVFFCICFIYITAVCPTIVSAALMDSPHLVSFFSLCLPLLSYHNHVFPPGLIKRLSNRG